jgi:hypothetical protein
VITSAYARARKVGGTQTNPLHRFAGAASTGCDRSVKWSNMTPELVSGAAWAEFWVLGARDKSG